MTDGFLGVIRLVAVHKPSDHELNEAILFGFGCIRASAAWLRLLQHPGAERERRSLLVESAWRNV